MVTRSDIDWNQHKKDVKEVIESKYGKSIAGKFLNFYSNRYDNHKRSFLDYRLAFWLVDDYNYAKRVGTKWYAFVGVGGTGKTTMAKNVLYFLDPSFILERICYEFKDIVSLMDTWPKTRTLKSVLMDEPDESINFNRPEGKVLKSIFGKARQGSYFLAFCATDLNDIPATIFRKLDGIFFLPYMGKFMFFKNRPKKLSYPLQKIRMDYWKIGYGVFFKLRKEAGCLVGTCHSSTPFNEKTEKKYLDIKEKDYDKTIKEFINMNNGKKPEKKGIEKTIANMAEKGLKHSEIAKYVGLSRSRVTQILGSAKKAENVNVRG